jgi:hypothetical protein
VKITISDDAITAKAYADAAAALSKVQQGSPVPALYLYRHALELALKEVLETALVMQREYMLRKELFGNGVALWAEADGDWSKLTGSHDLKDLCKRASRNLAALGLPQLPAEFEEAVQLVDDLEGGAHDGLRYSRIKPKGGRWLDTSTVYGKQVDIAAVASSLKLIIEEHLVSRAWDGEERENLYQKLQLNRGEVNDALFGDVISLDWDTRSGAVIWALVEAPITLAARDAWGFHQYDAGSYLRCTYRERPMAIARLADYGWGKAYALTRLDAPGKRFVSLTEGGMTHHSSLDLPAQAEKSAAQQLPPP